VHCLPQAASDAVVAAESAATKHGLYEALCQLALVRKAMGDFVVCVSVSVFVCVRACVRACVCCC
jgi:hypothetical protein